MKFTYEPSGVFQHQYSCGFERDEDALEGNTQWVRDKISHFNSCSTPLSRSISRVPGSLPIQSLVKEHGASRMSASVEPTPIPSMAQRDTLSNGSFHASGRSSCFMRTPEYTGHLLGEWRPPLHGQSSISGISMRRTVIH
jgi:hypothetical protein